MQPDERDTAYLWDMLDYSRRAIELTERQSLPEYLNDRFQQMALERCVEIIGEAARRVSMEFREAHPEIPWRRIIAQRNVMAHEYDDILQELLWKTATEDVPALIELLAPLIPTPPKEDETA